MEAVSPGVNLVEAQRLLSLFAQGISGRYFHLEPQPELKGQFRPAPALRERRTLLLPDAVDEFAEPRQNLGLYKVAVMHQLGFFEFETWRFELAEARRRIPGVDPDDDAEESGDLERFFAGFEERGLVRRLFEALEHYRVDCALRRAYPGLRRDLDRAMALARERREALPWIEGAAGLLEALLRCTLEADLDGLRRADGTGLVDGVIDAARRVAEPDADVYTTAEQSIRCLALMKAAGIETAIGTLDAIEGAVDPIEFRGDAPLDLVQRHTGTEATQEALRRGGAIPPDSPRTATDVPGDLTAREPADALQRHTDSARRLLRRPGADVGREERSFLYDEWSYDRRAYLRGWCRLYEQRLKGERGAEFLESLHHRHGGLLARVRRQFQRIKPESIERVRKVPDGEEIDLDRAIEARSDIRAGLAPSERVYMRRDPARREVAAALLVDLSASVSQPVSDPDAEPQPVPVTEYDYRYFWGTHPLGSESDEPRRTVLDIQREALGLMVQALEALGDEYGIYGFSGESRAKVEFYVAKEFGDYAGAHVWNAIAAMRSRRYTRMGTAIRHTIRKLHRQDARRKVMLVISDGYPQDTDYGPDADDREYAIHDTARALREAELAHIETFCVTVDRAGHDYLRKMCPEGRYLVIDEVESLPLELGKVYRQLTRS